MNSDLKPLTVKQETNMKFTKVESKGLAQCLVAETLDPKKLRVHNDSYPW